MSLEWMQDIGEQPTLPKELIKRSISDEELKKMSDDEKIKAWRWRMDTPQECERFWHRINRLLKK